ncbi:MAG TPA: hypothetical protein VMH27_10775 [Puia sp.]|nr:hypothetical protein [Puia sp.]
MTFIRPLVFPALLLAVSTAAFSQSAAWRTLRSGKISLKYPPAWHATNEPFHSGIRITLTPDSLKDMAIRAVEILEAPVKGDLDFTGFKADFKTIIRSRTKDDTTQFTTMVKQIVFKGRETVYVEALEGGIPAKVYGINGGTVIYYITLLARPQRGSNDRQLGQDEEAILNSLVMAL